jgi:hypothetical protein
MILGDGNDYIHMEADEIKAFAQWTIDNDVSTVDDFHKIAGRVYRMIDDTFQPAIAFTWKETYRWVTLEEWIDEKARLSG